MPCLTFNLSANGSLLDLAVSISKPRQVALQKAGKTIPSPAKMRGLIDTGASCTCIDPEIIKSLNLAPTGVTSIATPSTGKNAHICNQFDVSIKLVHPSHVYTISVLPIIETHLSHLGFDALIGRDVLSRCLLVYNGPNNTYTLAF